MADRPSVARWRAPALGDGGWLEHSTGGKARYKPFAGDPVEGAEICLTTALPAHVTTAVTGSTPQATWSAAFAARQVRRCHPSQDSSTRRAMNHNSRHAGQSPCRYSAPVFPGMPGGATPCEHRQDFGVKLSEADSDSEGPRAQLRDLEHSWRKKKEQGRDEEG